MSQLGQSSVKSAYLYTYTEMVEFMQFFLCLFSNLLVELTINLSEVRQKIHVRGLSSDKQKVFKTAYRN